MIIYLIIYQKRVYKPLLISPAGAFTLLDGYRAAVVRMAKTGSQRNQKVIGDPDRQNVARAANAYRAITVFRHAAGLNMADGIEAAISDLVFSLAHLSDREGCDFGLALWRAKRHYERTTAAAQASESNGAQFERIHVERPPL